ncbi:MAG: hypothetical protein LBG48_05090, partial [Rickettsiales bacterium]|nr:hypothetical protein [Rickettsiales bacterium]
MTPEVHSQKNIAPPQTYFFNDHFSNFKRYNIPKAQLILTDIPYNIGENAYGSSPEWYIGGDNKNGENKKKAKKRFFNSDGIFKIPELLHFTSQMIKPESKCKGGGVAMIIFCSFI